MAAPWVRLFICGRTNAAHRPRAPLPTPTPQRGKIQQGSPAPASCCLPLPTAWYRRSRKRVHEPPNPGRPPFHRGTESLEPRPGYTLTRTGGWPGVCTMWTRCMRLKMRIFLSRRTILPQPAPTPKKKKTGAALPRSPNNHLPRLYLSKTSPRSPSARPGALNHSWPRKAGLLRLVRKRRLPPRYSSENSSPSSSSASGSQSTKNVSGSSPRAMKKDITSKKVAFSRSLNGSSSPM